MKNKYSYFFYILLIKFFFITTGMSSEIFNFNVREVEILENGNKFLGKKGGTAISEDGTIINAKNFDYNKSKNILIATGEVEIIDVKDNITINSEKITYFKNKELIITEGKSKAFNDGIIIEADKFRYNKYSNILNAKGNVKIDDKIENYILNTNDITYDRTNDKIFTKGKTLVLVETKYNFVSSDVKLDRKLKELSSNKKSTVEDDKSNFYKLKNFLYLYDKKLLKGKNVDVVTNYLKDKSDQFYFNSAFINFKNNSFKSKNTKIVFHKQLFDNEREKNDDQLKIFSGKNDPRISSISSKGNKDEIVMHKAIFTSCEKNEKCPAWSIKANKITHDRIKKNIYYKDAVLNIYDVPVFYFPKFFHPDPTVIRRSGLLQPRLNNSTILGTSFNLPYFHVISENKDLTFKPTIFDNRIYMFQNEYRQENENSSFIADFNYIKGYQSSLANNEFSNRNSINHLFSKFNLDLKLPNFEESKFKFFIEKVNNDTYLKVFEDTILVDKDNFENDLKDKNNLTSGIEIYLDHENYNLTTGLTSYENLQKRNSDRFEFVLPYYDFTATTLFSNERGSLNFGSTGRNSLSNTNNLRSNITNSINYTTKDIFSKKGFVNNFGIYFKNLNITGKNDIKYKSNFHSELLNIYEVNSSLPLIKMNKLTIDYIIPKISFRINPSDMKNYSSDDRLITTDNIFDINRLGLSDSYESGKSISFGIDYKKEDKIEVEKYLEIKLAGVLRDTGENKIPKSSSLNRTSSNLFGSIENSFSEFFSLNYDFSLDNDFNKFEHNSLEAELTINNFVTKFNFLEKNGELGEVNTLENLTEINFDENNSLIFKTRRNRTISLTEYYDLVYEYQNDCLTAGVKYRKTYYQDRDLKPKEDLFFTITLFPLTTLDQKIDQQMYRGDNAIQNLF